MSAQFCKVGKIKPNLNKLMSLKELENNILYFVEDSSKMDYPKNLNAAF